MKKIPHVLWYSPKLKKFLVIDVAKLRSAIFADAHVGADADDNADAYAGADAKADGGLVSDPSHHLLGKQNYGCGCFAFRKAV